MAGEVDNARGIKEAQTCLEAAKTAYKKQDYLKAAQNVKDACLLACPLLSRTDGAEKVMRKAVELLNEILAVIWSMGMSSLEREKKLKEILDPAIYVHDTLVYMLESTRFTEEIKQLKSLLGNIIRVFYC